MLTTEGRNPPNRLIFFLLFPIGGVGGNPKIYPQCIFGVIFGGKCQIICKIRLWVKSKILFDIKWKWREICKVELRCKIEDSPGPPAYIYWYKVKATIIDSMLLIKSFLSYWWKSFLYQLQKSVHCEVQLLTLI